MYSSFSDQHVATATVDFTLKLVQKNDNTYRVQLWDIAGQDKNVYITKTLGKDCFGAIVLCEAKSEDSLKATSNWKTIIDEQITFFDLCPLPVFLIENKSDLYEDDNASDEKLKQFSEENNFDNYFRVSAKTGKNMNEAMNEILAKIVQKIKEYGKNTIYELGLSRIDSELINIIGKLHFRTSYGQNALKHSKEVAYISGLLAAELGENVNLAKRAGLLHDIGKAIDFEMEGSHVDIGVDIAKKYNENKIVINAIASHHGDAPATSAIAAIVNIADTISASRPGARNDSSENYFQRLEKIEQIGNNIKGVDKAYAIQAGRELRVIVKPEEIDDLMSYQVARNIKEQIEDEVQYPGTIKVTVIRETRATEEAK